MLRGALALIGLAVAALVGGQIALPRAAERRLTSDLSHSGRVTHVRVEAFPAIKLLFKRADRVEVEMSEVRAGTTGKLVQLLRRTRQTKELKASADLVTLGPLRLHAASLTKDHDELSGRATVSEQELAAALPSQLRLRPVDDPSGELVLEGSVGPITARARLTARDGALVVAPEGLLGGLGSLTVFKDSRVKVTDVASKPGPQGFTLSASGRLAG
jgi:LmeA-like phospholipid-binding